MERDSRRFEALGPVLTPEQWAALDAIVGSPGLWASPSDVGAAASGRGGPGPALSALIDAALVVWWDGPGDGQLLADGPLVTLTPWGAWVLGLESVEDVDGFPRWVPAERLERPARRPIRIPRRPGEYGLPLADRLIDPAPGPDYLLDEESGRPVRLFAGGLGRPPAAPGSVFDGIPVVIDRRLRGAPAATRRRK